MKIKILFACQTKGRRKKLLRRNYLHLAACFPLNTIINMFKASVLLNAARLSTSPLYLTTRSTLSISLFHSSVSLLATKTKNKSKTSTQKIKPHVLRDRLREKKVANLIRKVTGSQVSTEKTNKDPADKKGPSFPVSN
jgi:hypothetical protein